jgi:hypothetical protein
MDGMSLSLTMLSMIPRYEVLRSSPLRRQQGVTTHVTAKVRLERWGLKSHIPEGESGDIRRHTRRYVGAVIVAAENHKTPEYLLTSRCR